MPSLTFWCIRATTEQVNEERIKELDEQSQKSRTKREELATRLYTAETELRGKVQDNKTVVSDVLDCRNHS